MTPLTIYLDFLRVMSSLCRNKKKVTKVDFMSYYDSVSVQISSDFYFDMLVRKSWGLGDAGAPPPLNPPFGLVKKVRHEVNQGELCAIIIFLTYMFWFCSREQSNPLDPLTFPLQFGPIQSAAANWCPLAPRHHWTEPWPCFAGTGGLWGTSSRPR